MNNNNKVELVGKIVSGFEFSHELRGEKFYEATIAVKRLSGNVDLLKLLVAEYIADKNKDICGTIVKVMGTFRSHNSVDEGKNKLLLNVYVDDIEKIDVCEDNSTKNEILLNGYLCKTPIYRKTPLGREIAELFIAVNRPYGKADYIPCIAWGRQAEQIEKAPAGTHVKLTGRIQSREYVKALSETESETRIAYEVSVRTIKCIHE